jgi:Secretion system C-terminal sorting domain
MRNKLLLFIFILSTISAFGQTGTTIDYVDGLGPLTMNYLDVFNTKRRYRAFDSGCMCNIDIYWSSTRWEISASNDVLYFSNANTALNPPNLTVGNWQEVVPAGPNLITLQGTGTTSMVLPVELTEFNVQPSPIGFDLSWITASENNNDYFSVERSADGRTFESIGQVKGAGTSIVEQSYTFTDKNPLKGYNYYRLNQVDYDGKSEYSPVRSVKLGTGSSAILSPNPIQQGNSANLMVDATDENDLTIEVFNTLGQAVLRQQTSVSKGVNSIQLELLALPKGIYTLTTKVGAEIGQSQQFIVQ